MVDSWPPAHLTPVSADAIARGDGEFAALFAEAFGSIGKDGIAGRAGEALRMRPWQVELLKHLYARDENGGLVHQRALLGLPRKNGKSALSSAAIGLYSLLAEGINGGEVIAVAAEKEQARIVFGEAKRMIESQPELAEMCVIYKDSIFVPATNSVFKVVSAEAYSKEGLNPSRVIMDELHAHKTRDLWDVFSLAMGNRGKIAQLVAITTAGVKSDSTGQDSICYSLYQHGKRVASNEVADPSFFMAWWEADPDGNYKDPVQWRKANPGFDDIVGYEDFESASATTPEAEFRTKRLNQWVTSKQAWLPSGVWADLTDEVELLPTDEYFLGFDGSWNNDSTALVAVIAPRFEGDVFRVKFVNAWEKNFAVDNDSWVVDKVEVKNFVMAFFDAHPNMKEMPCDPTYWESEMWEWQDYGIPVVEYKNTIQRTVPATSKLYEGIMNKKIRHDGNQAVARHMENCILKLDPKLGARLTKDYKNPKLKIDLAIALMMAYDRATARLDSQVVPEFFSF